MGKQKTVKKERFLEVRDELQAAQMQLEQAQKELQRVLEVLGGDLSAHMEEHKKAKEAQAQLFDIYERLEGAELDEFLQEQVAHLKRIHELEELLVPQTELEDWREELEQKDLDLCDRDKELESRLQQADIRKLRSRLRKRGEALDYEKRVNKQISQNNVELAAAFRASLQREQALEHALKQKVDTNVDSRLLQTALGLRAALGRIKDSGYELTEEDQSAIANTDEVLATMLESSTKTSVDNTEPRQNITEPVQPEQPPEQSVE